jgi:acetoacetate decarboxylase
MTEDEVKARAFAMPLTSPAFPPGPYRFVNREFLIIAYRTDPDALAAVIPAPLEMTDPVVKFEFFCEDVTVKGAWEGTAALELFHHALAPVASLPVLEVISGVHILSDLTLGLGTVVHDYLA